MSDRFLDIANLAVGTGGGLVSRIGQKKREKRQLGYEKELMGIEFQQQQQLNEQAQQLAMKTWADTNYPAQMKMIKEAGLNPALLYGMGGAGGATTSAGSGGSGGSGSAPRVENLPFDINNAVAGAKLMKELELLESQKNLTDEQANKTGNEADKIAGVDTELVGAQIKDLTQGVKNKKAVERLTNAQTELAEIEKFINEGTKYDRIDEIKYRARTALFDMGVARSNDRYMSETLDDRIKMAGALAIGAVIDNSLKRANVDLTRKKIDEISNSIAQKWETLSQGLTGLNQKDRDLKIRQFEAELKAEFPSLMNVGGRAIQGIMDIGGWIDSAIYGIPTRRDKVDEK